MLTLSDWDESILNDCEVVICSHSDVMVKPIVYAALQCSRAMVFVAYSPDGHDSTKWVLDDYLAAGHTLCDLGACIAQELLPAM